MNIIVTNKYRDLLENSNIEIMKNLNGVFKVSEIKNSIGSLFYKKLIIDATAIKDFPKENVIRELASSFDLNNLILFLPPDNPIPRKFLSFLISLNIYNFTDNINGLIELVRRSNTYNDVSDFAINNNNSNKEVIDDTSQSNDNFGNYILGVKDVTGGVNSTVLTYVLKKAIEVVHKKNVVALEIDNRDFVYYNDTNMYSISKNQIKEYVSNNSNCDVILVDLNNETDFNFCDDVIYLIDPSLFSINRLVYQNKNIFSQLSGKKIIFVNSLLSESDVNQFAKEAGISVYFNLPPLNDRVHNKVVDSLLLKLGIIEAEVEKTKKGLFDLFK